MTIEDEETLVERQLEAGAPKDDLDNLDLSVEPGTELIILRNMRTRYTQDYYMLKTSARLNRLVENTQLADSQDKDLKNLVRQIAQLEKEIQALVRQLS